MLTSYRSYLGIVKTINCTKEIICQTGINNNITNIGNAFEICSKHRNKRRKEPIIQHDVQDIPWTKVAMDIFHLGGKRYLALVDYATNFFQYQSVAK